MDRDEMRNGDGPSAVRVIPADGVSAAAPGPPGSGGGPQGRRWLLPAVVVGVALLAFAAATRPAPQLETEAAPPTVPPGLAEVSTELIDLTNPTAAGTTTNEWDTLPFQWPGRINDILPFNSSLFAFGQDEEGAAAWLSSTGAGWRDVPRFERPDNPKSSIDHAVVWNGTVVALGAVGNEVGRWTARTLSHWFYGGTVPEMDDWVPQGLAATDRLLTISEKDGRHRGWVSDDGVQWTELEGVADLDEMTVLSLVGIDDWFYAAGTERAQPGGRAVIYRSRDGESWQRVRGLGNGALSAADGMVDDLAQTADGLLAMGTANGGQIVVWSSSDGDSWAQVATDGLAGKALVVELRSTSEAGEALFVIDGEEHRLVAGSRVLTEVGLMRVAEVTASYAQVDWVDGTSEAFQAGAEGRRVELELYPQRIAAEGPRIVIAGAVGVQQPMTPAVWTSTDGGITWKTDYPDPAVQGWAVSAAISGANITTAGATDTETPQIWHSTWNTQRLEDDAIDLAEAYFEAVEQRNIGAMVALLPGEPVRVQLPSLGRVDLSWWDESTGAIDPGAVGETVAYLDALSTSITIGECRATVRFGDSDSVRISCEFDVASDLLATYSNEEHSGTAEIIVEDGAIRRLHLSTVPSATMWQMLGSGFGNRSSAEREVLDDPTTPELDPTFTAASARLHLRLTEEFIAGLLRPGDTRIVETVLGPMEWSWLDPLPIPVYTTNWITAYRDGFVAIGQGEPDRWTDETSLWQSQDGVNWEQMDGPPNVTGMWNLQPFRGGLIGQAWEQDRSFLAIYDGAEWSELELPSGESGQYFDVQYLATSGDNTLVITVAWSEGYEAGPDAHQAWLVGPDNVPRQVDLPIDLWGSDQGIGMAGSDEGFLLGTARYGSPRSIRIWFSPDGSEWDEMAAMTSIENAAYVWSLERHNDRYFVVGEGAETNCSTSSDGSSFCQQLVSLWSSPDGADWERVFTTSGEPVGAYELGSGALGLAALAADFYSDTPLPRPIYLSDGTSWERAGNLALLHPDAEWWWASLPAVGSDTILIPGSAYDPTSSAEEDQPFLIVGRLVDG